ncbi:ADP-ribose glycohydrolase OARD1 isoform X4 [Sceloporus undulatus]|uniref:ADP-ribose glycohydrolase OARD1 isoform X4 n=1 Tax=Sceloporus undulatus TaxID=8520 RepID=UPI001C4CB2E5|nr:ADP-ribose glycohydrolase OARD1 isoform X4 [Sceloporus undulatus]
MHILFFRIATVFPVPLFLFIDLVLQLFLFFIDYSNLFCFSLIMNAIFLSSLATEEILKNSHAIMASIQPAKEERIVYRQGDLFTCPETNSLAHCISEDCHMSAGIAAVFKKKFGGVEELLNQQKKTGEVAVLKRDNRYVYYLITKNKYFHKPTYDKLQKSLEAMKFHCVENGVTHISMPKIGCGLDRLDWRKVSAMLEEVFEGTGVYITVYTL